MSSLSVLIPGENIPDAQQDDQEEFGKITVAVQGVLRDHEGPGDNDNGQLSPPGLRDEGGGVSGISQAAALGQGLPHERRGDHPRSHLL